MLMRPHPQFLTRHDAPGRRELAYLAQQGAGPAVIWLGGFRSDMRATKAEALANWAAQEGRALLRFDYTGHGESGGSFDEATIAVWLADVLAMIAHAGGEKPILVGSSMGGWLALLAARALRAKGRSPGGLVLIAPAVDFTELSVGVEGTEMLMQSITGMVLDNGTDEPISFTGQGVAGGQVGLEL
jgi:pimeloyl-ACP methyl ester carboxylesterase